MICFLKKIFARLFFILWILLAIVFSLLIAIIVIFLSFFPINSSKLRILLKIWGRLLVYSSLSSAKLLDTHKLPKEYGVIISNHQSMFDIFIAAGFLKKIFYFFLKKKYFQYL